MTANWPPKKKLPPGFPLAAVDEDGRPSPALTRCLLLLAFVPVLGWAQPQSLFIADLTWREVKAAIAAGKTTAIYYAGSTEQGGPHLVLGKHNLIASYVAGRIATELG